MNVKDLIKFILCFCVISLLVFSCSDPTMETDIPINDKNIDTLKLDTEFNLQIELRFNSDIIGSDVKFKLIDNRFVAYVPLTFDKSNVVLSYNVSNAKVFVDDKELVCGVSHCDLSALRHLCLVNRSDTLNFELLLLETTNLPTIFIDIQNMHVIDKESWIQAKIDILEYRNKSVFSNHNIFVKGRGNTTWDNPKKPLTIKFNNNAEVLGMPPGDRWVLLANAFDPTMMRASVGFYLSANHSKLDYTPRMVFVDLYLNGEYQGVYEFGEHIKIDKDRVNVSKDGFILEVDAKWTEGDPVFKSSRGIVFNIKDPGFGVTASEFDYITGYISQIENLLYSDNFCDSTHLYKEYLDVESFVDWYLVNEITKNNDAIFFTSCYMHLKPGEKLKMGPVWDFDLAIGNVSYNNNDVPEGFWIKDAAWICRMFLDPEFVSLVKSRFAHFYHHRQQLFSAIEMRAEKMNYALFMNNRKWNSLTTNIDEWDFVHDQYHKELNKMMRFLERRYEWLNDHMKEL
ncbi:MAG: CotH kinase family protein [Paludibacteraceae bacterium]|nr:CotH kinase family protein [Paludibacteraceae bacterium]